MKITILGCGASSGVPVVGCGCAVCVSDNPKNKRLRVSVLVEENGRTLLVDTSPDLRQQCLNHNITRVDAILYTHDHADHTHGIDDVRSINYHRQGAVDIYADSKTLNVLQERFGYVFRPPVAEYGWFRPAVVPHVIEAYQPFTVQGMEILPIEQVHGKVTSLGFRFGKFAYSTDVNALSDKAVEALQGVEVWVVDCLKETPAPTHAHLALTLEWIERVKPRLAVLTHMSHELEYDALLKKLPTGVVPGYDGLVIEI